MDTNKLWSTVDDRDYLFSGGIDSRISYYTKFEDDTLINGYNYKKIFNSMDVNLLIWDHVGYLREDTSKKIFARDMTGNEGLIYDFDVNIGDTIYFNNPFFTYAILDSLIIVDTIYQINYAGALRNAIDVRRDIGGQETWVEGVGNTIGILEGGYGLLSYTGWSVRLLCFFENDTLLYHYAPYSECFYENVNNVENSSLTSEINIYPNPASSFLQVSSESIKLTSCSILDIYGKVVKQFTISNTHTINVADLQKGIYFIKLQTSAAISLF